mgnify:FL=1
MMDQRLRMLRDSEHLCYRVCHYLLQNEKLALETAKLALLELARNPDFYACPQEQKQDIIRRVAARKCLMAYYSHKDQRSG